ncbi:hypothetical protein EJ03DRAFT_168033 [Teratosphaeria nubilosa]|uniref:Uncharacterized protein n=1 Tax=Teratosphaeria nubilosa TaxID=161662 RepID=A0A6G1L251_9PEZI|nr:hypothetical protein EJ03DRAFT_168033 [Teratosphaeria nubilosa]
MSWCILHLHWHSGVLAASGLVLDERAQCHCTSIPIRSGSPACCSRKSSMLWKDSRFESNADEGLDRERIQDNLGWRESLMTRDKTGRSGVCHFEAITSITNQLPSLTEWMVCGTNDGLQKFTCY